MTPLFDYQITSRDFLAARTRALLADEPRVGKSPAAVAACDVVGAKNIFVVAPAVALYQWARMFQRFGSKRPIHILDQGGMIVPEKAQGVWIASYDRVRIMMSEKRIEARFDVLIIDESHYLGNPEAERTRAVLGKDGLAWKADRVWCLSGTPATNNAAQLWPVMRSFGLTPLDYERFKYTYCQIHPLTGRAVGVRHASELRALLQPVMLRRTLAGVRPDDSAVTLEDYAVKPDASYLDESEEVDEQLLAEVLAGKTGDELLAAIPKAEVSTLRRYHALLKVKGCVELIKEDFASGEASRLIVFAYHESAITLLSKQLLGVSVRAITGKETAKQKAAAAEWFARDGGHKVLLCNIVAAGIAIDLSCAQEAIMLELDWTPGNNVQAMLRMQGPNQKGSPRVRVLIANGTIDDRIVQVLTRKARDLKSIFN